MTICIRDAIFTRLPREKLAESITTVNELARPYDDNFHDEMVEQYGRIRLFLPKLLNDLEFRAAPAGKPVESMAIAAILSSGLSCFLKRGAVNLSCFSRFDSSV